MRLISCFDIKMIIRFLLAALLAVAIMPTANNVARDPISTGDVEMPAHLAADVKAHVAHVAASYGIKTPVLHFVDSNAAGVTIKDAKTSMVEIRLGRPVQTAFYQEHSELLKATAAHEVGHAVMMARNQEFALLPIIGMYAIGFFPFLVVFPTKRGIAVAAVAIGSGLAALGSLPKFALPNDAYLFLLSLLAVSAVLLMVVRLDELLQTKSGEIIAPHLPSRQAFAGAGVIAVAAFFTTYWLVGGMNIERELRADVIGACANDPATMKAALLHLSNVPTSSLKEAFDTFHPSMLERQAMLTVMENNHLRDKACAAVQSGTTSLSINGRVIQ